jgi:non-heme chloroperoxidase
MVWRSAALVGRALLASTLLVAHAVTAQNSSAGNASKGRDVFLRYCSGCHGEDGRGEAKTFRPNVGNLAVKQLMDELSDEYLFTVIQKGGAAVGKNAAMPAWNAQLRDDEIRDVVAFVRTLCRRGGTHMSAITVKDGTTIYYKDWGKGPVVTFSHGWPLSSDAWDGQMLFLAQNGFRVVAHDRRGHGRSSQASSGNDLNGYADDLAAVIEALDLKDATLVGHSTGGGEVARYIGRHGTKRVARAVLVAAIPPLMLKTAANPEGLPMEVFDGLRSGLAKDRSQFYKDLAGPFYGANKPGAKVSQGVLDQFWLWSMQCGLKNAYESIKAFSETDLTEDLKKFDIPTLVMHGDDDQIVPVKNHAEKSARLIKGAKIQIYPGAPHGLTATHQDRVNTDLLAFLRS